MNKEKQITIKYSKYTTLGGHEEGSQKVTEKGYNKAKNRLEKLGYKVSKQETK